MDTNKNLRSFTLIELLVVLALVAILSVVVILTLNPAELLKQARDSNRLSDLATINTALNLFSTDVTSGFMGTSTVVYVSIPSASPTCTGLGLPSLPSGYTYNCATSQNLRNTDGSGWIPVNFQRISSNSPISQLPIDPINTTSTRLYYTYVPGGSWELNASIEASKNKLGGSNDLTSRDGGSAPSLYEIGNNLNLNPLETGDPTLVGYWNFEEGPNATSSDRSGYGNHGTWYGTSTAEQHYATGKVGNYAGSFNGSNDYILIPTSSQPTIGANDFTISLWIQVDGLPVTTDAGIFSINDAAAAAPGYYLWINSASTLHYIVRGSLSLVNVSPYSTPSGRFTHVVLSYSFNNALGSKLYIDGFLVDSRNSSPVGSIGNNLNLIIGRRAWNAINTLNGKVDDIRIYNRALSASEILALYNATK